VFRIFFYFFEKRFLHLRQLPRLFPLFVAQIPPDPLSSPSPCVMMPKLNYFPGLPPSSFGLRLDEDKINSPTFRCSSPPSRSPPPCTDSGSSKRVSGVTEQAPTIGSTSFPLEFFYLCSVPFFHELVEVHVPPSLTLSFSINAGSLAIFPVSPFIGNG